MNDRISPSPRVSRVSQAIRTIRESFTFIENPFKNKSMQKYVAQRRLPPKFTAMRLSSFAFPLLACFALITGIVVYQLQMNTYFKEERHAFFTNICTEVNTIIGIEHTISQLMLRSVDAFTPQSRMAIEEANNDFNIIASYFAEYTQYRTMVLMPHGVATLAYPSNRTNVSFGYDIMQIFTNTTLDALSPTNVIEFTSDQIVKDGMLSQVTVQPLYVDIQRNMTGTPYSQYYERCINLGWCIRNITTDIIICDEYMDICRTHKGPVKLWGVIVMVVPLTPSLLQTLLAPALNAGVDFYVTDESHTGTEDTVLIMQQGHWAHAQDDSYQLKCPIVLHKQEFLYMRHPIQVNGQYIAFMVIQCIYAILVPLLIFILLKERNRFFNLVSEFIPKQFIKTMLKGKRITQEYHTVSVLFSDIVGYTSMCASLHPTRVIDMLDELYKRYDCLVDKHGVYKTDIIGDAFMCMSGCPEVLEAAEGARRLAHFAFDMIRETADLGLRMGIKLQIRVGINTGPLYGCVLGTTVPHFYPFGDTVNIASRMESNGRPGTLHVSETTAELLNTYSEFNVVARDAPITVKGKGAMQTYFVEKIDIGWSQTRTTITTIADVSIHRRESSPSPQTPPSPPTTGTPPQSQPMSSAETLMRPTPTSRVSKAFSEISQFSVDLEANSPNLKQKQIPSTEAHLQLTFTRHSLKRVQSTPKSVTFTLPFEDERCDGDLELPPPWEDY